MCLMLYIGTAQSLMRQSDADLRIEEVEVSLAIRELIGQ